jgi:hypothetical protein
MSWNEADQVRPALIAAVLVALDRVELSRQDQVLVLAGALEELSLREQVDESALVQLVSGAES